VYGYLEAVFAIVDEGLWLAFLRTLLLAPVDRRADRVSYFGGVVELRATALARRAYCKGLIEDRTSRRALCRRDKTGSASFENSGLEPADRFHS